MVVRLQFPSGRATATPLPTLGHSGPVSFVAAAHRVIVRPYEAVEGFAVVDDHGVTPLTELLAEGGVLLPAGNQSRWELRHLWLVQGTSIRLVDDQGVKPISAIPVPPGFTVVGPDGAGEVLLAGPGGVYDANTVGLTRVTTGRVLAMGAPGWLVLDCGRYGRCVLALINRGGFSRARVAAATPRYLRRTRGIISPDGRTAALLEPDPSTHTPRVHLLNLSTGRDHALPLHVKTRSPSSMAWSPDSQRLFVATGRVEIVNPRTRRIRALHAAPPDVSLTQLAIRP